MIEILKIPFDKALYSCNLILKSYILQYTLQTTDRRGTVLAIKCMFVHLEGKVMVDFRMSRGCGLEFKKHFAKIKANCKEILDKAPILWPALVPFDALPKMFD